ncbi:PREDICTED: adiponectin receptor protein 1 [Calidris pugnax]|uniref:adiponectin receptor protein 1 n=1 Tax=Calidris pugnax TaxID=198806 RepID=UPI00071DFA54|nr:PREDICTED: adiponectin receptor protein 1 [Calidris pugnax]
MTLLTGRQSHYNRGPKGGAGPALAPRGSVPPSPGGAVGCGTPPGPSGAPRFPAGPPAAITGRPEGAAEGAATETHGPARAPPSRHVSPNRRGGRERLGPLLEEKGDQGAAGSATAEDPPCPAAREEEEEVVRVLTLPLQAHHAMEKMEEFVYKVWEGRWRVIPYDVLPDWLKDNDYLLHGHRPPMPSFRACFKSIFRIHTETGNIWTHLLGFVLFLCLGILTMLRPNMYFMAPLQEKVVFGMFFLGAVLCLSFSWLFHTVYCHSEKVSRTFSKLDYSGIALLIMGSFVPWLYYSFYCSPQPRLIYLSIVCVLGISAIIVAQWDRFATPKHRQTRAGVFLGLGLSGVVPTMHFTIAEGFVKATTVGQMGWFFLMAVMYITGAGLYAARIPERFFPGKFDIWFQSHQIFHVLVVAAAFVHFYGVSNLQEFRYGLEGGCTDDSLL